MFSRMKHNLGARLSHCGISLTSNMLSIDSWAKALLADVVVSPQTYIQTQSFNNIFDSGYTFSINLAFKEEPILLW